MQYARRRRKRVPKSKGQLIYEWIVAILVLAALIYAIATGSVPDNTSDF